MTSKEDRLKLFVNEINDIKDENLKEFAKKLITNADDYFFTIAASTTGKYHPPFDQGVGGLVRHTRVVIYFAECEATARMYSEHDRDLLIISALAHDMKKLGDGSGKYTTSDHPLHGANYVLKTFNENPDLISEEDANKVAKAVHSHMGQWGAKDGMPLPNTGFEWSMHMADYNASRKEITSFDFRPTETVNIVVEETKPSEYVIGFGKHKGKTLSELYKSDKEYMMWVASQTDFNNKEAQDKIKEYLAESNKK